MSVELGLAIVGAVDLCFKYGSLLIELYSTFRSAETQLTEQVLRLESIWLRTRSQLEFLKSVWQSLDESHQRIQTQVVDVLTTKLKSAVSKVQGLVKEDTTTSATVMVRRWKFVLYKEGLEKSIEDLEAWQKIFDPSWFLIMRIASPQIDRVLSNPVEGMANIISSASSLRLAVSPNASDKTTIFLPESGMAFAEINPIPYSTVSLVQRSGSKKWLLTEKITDPWSGAFPTCEKNVREIARRLSHADPIEFRLFKCYGVVRHYDRPQKYPTDFTFVFRTPEEFTEMNSLRHTLYAKDTNHSLSERFQIAKDLARALSYVHNFGFVHKNIRPETILLVRNNSTDLGTPFLVGFHTFRKAGAGTARFGDTDWNLNIYRHPLRQGGSPSEDFVMQHDIYSLGVCLLELGMFQSFVITDIAEGTITPSPLLARSMNYLNDMGPAGFKNHLVSLAERNLPRIMGSKYADIVITCLTCLDEDNADFGDEGEFKDADGILVSVRYIEKVLGQLNSINV